MCVLAGLLSRAPIETRTHQHTPKPFMKSVCVRRKDKKNVLAIKKKVNFLPFRIFFGVYAREVNQILQGTSPEISKERG